MHRWKGNFRWKVPSKESEVGEACLVKPAGKGLSWDMSPSEMGLEELGSPSGEIHFVIPDVGFQKMMIGSESM